MRSARLVPVLIAINIFVYLMWHQPGYFSEAWMSDHFLVSWGLLQEGHWWTLLGSVFSQNILVHLLVNMMVLSSFGSILETALGSRRFLVFYLLAGIFSSLTHSLVSMFLLNEPDLPALGASGAIAGVILVFSLMFPREKLLLFWVIPMPALVGAFIFVGLDLWGLLAQAHGGGLPIGHGAHLGGAFFGLLYYFFYLRPRRSRLLNYPF